MLLGAGTYVVVMQYRHGTLASLWKKYGMATAIAGLIAAPIWIYYQNPTAAYGQHLDTFQFIHKTAFGIVGGIFGNLVSLGAKWIWVSCLLLVLISFGLRDETWFPRLLF